MKAAGWNPSVRYPSAGKVMHFSQESSRQAIQGWLDSAYHRESILDSTLDEVGIALVDGTAVVNLGAPGHPVKCRTRLLYTLMTA